MPPTKPKRPQTIEILECLEDADGTLCMHVDVAGHVCYFCVSPAAVRSRKLAYGLARVIADVTHDGNRIIPTPPQERTVEDLVDDADEEALRIFFEEWLDAYDDDGTTWAGQNPGRRLSQTSASYVGRTLFARREEHEKRHKMRKRAPKRLHDRPHTRFVHKDAEGKVFDVEDIEGA